MNRCLLVLLTILSSGVGAVETIDSICSDTIVIDSAAYAVPQWWCPHRIDSADIADPTTLVRLPAQYCEKDYRIYLERDARNAFVKMAEAALADSIGFLVRSGYRSPGYQSKILKRRVREGQLFRSVMWAVAPPGYSQHHTGRAVDLTSSDTTESSFADSRAYRWLRENASRFDFGETYPPEIQPPPASEPWHWYYLGPLTARDTTRAD